MKGKIGMRLQSDVTGKFYRPDRCCFITNPKQAALYIKHGAELLDLLVDRGDMLVYVFDKAATSQLYRKWQNYQLV